MKKILKTGLLTALAGTFLFANNASDLAQKIASKIHAKKIDYCTNLTGAAAAGNKVILKIKVNDNNSVLRYTFNHKKALEYLKESVTKQAIHNFCSNKDIRKQLKLGVEYELDYKKASDNQDFLVVNINNNTCKM
jgi:hypothetical protein